MWPTMLLAWDKVPTANALMLSFQPCVQEEPVAKQPCLAPVPALEVESSSTTLPPVMNSAQEGGEAGVPSGHFMQESQVRFCQP